MKYINLKYYGMQSFNKISTKTKTYHIRKILILMIAIFLGIIMFGANKSYGAETITTDEYSHEITWEYDLDDNNNATKVRIKQVKKGAGIIVPSKENINHYYEIPRYEMGTLTIPTTLDGHIVTSIGDGSNRIINPDNGNNVMEVSIEALVIPSTVVEINDYAFENCISIKEIDFGNSIERIGNYAFRNLINLKNSGGESYSLVIPDSVKEIGKGAFEINSNGNYSVEGDKIVYSRITIAGYTQWIWRSIYPFNNIVLGSSVTNIGDFAFAGNKVLSTIEIPSNVANIGVGAFAGCSNVKSIVIDSRTTTLKVQDYAFSNLNNKLENVTISNNVNFGKGIFKNDSKIKTVVIQDGTTTISEGLFENCTELTDITVGNSVTTIEANAFSGCSKLTIEDYNNIAKNATSIGDYAFSGCTGFEGKIILKDIVTNLGNGVFSGCTNITSAEVNSNITTLSANLFYRCINLTDITIGENINTIGADCFYDCDAISIETLHNKILPNIININGFAGCDGLIGELIIPSNVKTIGERAFYSCKGIKKITFNEGIETIGSNAFYGLNDIPEIIYFPSTIKSIGTMAFSNIREAYFETTEPILADRWYGVNDVITHFSDCKHTLDVTCFLPGVKLINTATGEEFTTGEYDCESSQTFRVEIEDGYSYPDLAIKIISDGQYASSELVKEFIQLNSNNEYTIENLIRDKRIIVQKSQNETDLVLRQFITKVNNNYIDESRKPNIVTSRTLSNMLPITYQHTKYPVSVEVNDTVTYCIRVYNEGDVEGRANEIKVYLQDGLELAQNNLVNTTYNWKVIETSNEGTIITSDYLKDKLINSYRGEGKTEYEEIELVCKVAKQEQKRLVSIAELSDSSDVDSLPNSIKLSELAGYKESDSYTSDTTSYIQSAEDDTDFESVELKEVVKVGYTIALEKIDSTSLELLNGAKFNLYDKDKNLLETKVTVNNGKLEFGERITYGEGTDTYYIEEVETPAGYLRTIDGMIELSVKKTINTDGSINLQIICDVSEEFNLQEKEYIPITKAEQLMEIGSNESIEIDGKNYVFAEDANYRLENDLDIGNINWEPIPNFEGVFDGNNHKITNLTINENLEYDGNMHTYGLFKQLSGIVKNLELENINIDIKTDLTEIDIDEQLREAWYKYSDGEITNTEYLQICELLENLKEKSARCKPQIGGLAGYCIKGKIENCSISGKINADFRNVGGFIGHTSEGNNIKMINCTNYANITAIENAGGLVGCSKGGLELIDCINKGTITSNSCIAGGLVGVGEITTYVPQNIIVGYDEASQKITIAIKNKKTEGSYDLVIEKVDLDNDIKLDGAEFNIYDENMNLIKENVLIENGKLKITTMVMNSLKSDVFYIKEVQAPDGYEILVKDYIKLVINKTWNSEKGKYDISVVPSVEKEKVDGTYKEDNTNTGEKFTVVQSEYVIWKTGKIKAVNCTNEGNVSATGTNSSAGGIIGLVLGSVDIQDCENTGNITAQNHSGGIAGFLAGYQNNMTSTIVRCSNGIESDTENEYGVLSISSVDNGAVGGIVGITVSDTTISECYNYSDISSVSHTGGMVGLSDGKSLYVYDCCNLGDICVDGSIGYRNAGGMVGTQTMKNSINILGGTYNPISNSGNLEIIDCTLNANIQSNTGHLGGMIGLIQSGNEVTISNCKIIGEESEKISIIGEKSNFAGAGGIIGSGCSTTLELNNNTVKNVKINNNKQSYGNTGGLVGEYSHQSDGTETYEIIVNDNIIENTEIEVACSGCASVAGLFGYLDTITRRGELGTIKINNCTIKSSNFKRIDFDEEYTASNSNVAGLIGWSTGDFSLEIKNTNVIDTDISFKGTGSGNHAGGLIGFANGYKIDIENCEVKSTDGTKHKIEMYTSDAYSPIGGLIGVAGYIGRDNNLIELNIKNSKVSGIEIYDATASAAGGVIGYSRSSTLSLDGVELDDMLLTLDKSTKIGSSNTVKGGFIGNRDSGNICIKECKFTNSIMNVKAYGSTGGIIGHSNDDNLISGLEIDNLKIIETAHEITNTTTAIGGVIGYGRATITDSKVNNLEIELNNSIYLSVGALIGCAGSCTVSNTTMNDIKMNCDLFANVHGKTACSIGGVVGTSWEPQITNVNIDGLGIKTSVANIGGLVGSSSGDSIISGCSVKNAVFESTESLTYASENTPANYAGLIATNYPENSLSISDSSVENLEISIEQGALAHGAGFVGVCGDVNISDGTVNNLQIRNNSHTGIIGGIVGVIANKYGTTTLKGQFTNTSVSDFHANVSANEYNTRIGGILGCGIATIKNAQVTNMSTEEVNENGYTAVGGIAGIAVEGSLLDTVTVNSTEDKQDEAILYSSVDAGGIAGVCSGKISNATVENITVQTKREISIPETDPDEISEEAKDSTEEQIVYLTNPYCAAIAAQYLEEFTNCIIRNVKVIYSNSTEIVNFE